MISNFTLHGLSYKWAVILGTSDNEKFCETSIFVG